jgi:hypothetical protein
MPIIPALGRLRQKDPEFEADLVGEIISKRDRRKGGKGRREG